MAILNFPSNPQLHDQYTGDNGTTYIFDGVKWVGHAVAQPAGTNSITNNGHTVQVDINGNLIIPTGTHILYQDGTSLAGAQGPQGVKGDTGNSGTVDVGITTTGIAGSSAEVDNVGTATAAIFNFTIPRGDKGDRGSAGLNGQNGLPGTNGLNGVGQKGDTGDKGDKGDQGVSVTLQGTKATIADLPAAPVNPADFAGHGWIVTTGDGDTHLDGSLWFWNLTDHAWNDVGQIQGPTGLKGDRGDRGLKGDTGTNGQNGSNGLNGLDGQGVPNGGSAGQILSKISSTDFDTHWVANDRLSAGVVSVVLNGGDSKLHIPGYLLSPYGGLRENTVDGGLSVDSFNQASLVLTSNGSSNQWIFGANGVLNLPHSVDSIHDAIIGSTFNIDLNANGSFFKFKSDGYLQLPNGSTIGSSNSFDGIPMTTDRGTILFGNSPTIGQPDHFHIAKQDPGNLNLFLGDDSNFVKLPSYGGVEITSEGTVQYTWTFGTDGSLRLPQGAQLLEKTWSTIVTGITIGSETFVTFADTEFMMVEEGQIVIDGITEGTTEANGTWYYRASDGNQCQLFADESYSFPVDSTSWTAYTTGGTVTLVTELELTSGTNAWKFSRDGSTTVPNGGKVIFGEQNGGSFIAAGMGFHFNSTEGIALDAVDVQTDAAHPVTRTWYFDPVGSLTLPNYTKQVDSANVTCNTGMDTVIYTGSNNMHTFKLLIKVEGYEVPNEGWDTQSTEMIIAKSFRNNTVAASAYGVVHTSTDPLATFSARWNPTISRVEVLCRPTSLTYGVEVRTFATEIITSD